MSTLEERAAATAAALLAADREIAFDVSIALAVYATIARRPGTDRARRTAILVALFRAIERGLSDDPSTDENLPEEVSPVRPGDRTP